MPLKSSCVEGPASASDGLILIVILQAEGPAHAPMHQPLTSPRSSGTASPPPKARRSRRGHQPRGGMQHVPDRIPYSDSLPLVLLVQPLPIRHVREAVPPLRALPRHRAVHVTALGLRRTLLVLRLTVGLLLSAIAIGSTAQGRAQPACEDKALMERKDGRYITQRTAGLRRPCGPRLLLRLPVGLFSCTAGAMRMRLLQQGTAPPSQPSIYSSSTCTPGSQLRFAA